MSSTPPSPYDQNPSGFPQPPDPASQPSLYGQQPTPYGQQPPAYGQQPPAYGQQPTPYGQQPTPYGQQPTPYGQPAYGQAPYAAPTQGSGYGPPSPPAKARTKPAILAAVAVGAVAVLGGGGAFVYQKLASSGAQPDTVIPASAMMYARLDLDPSAGQKIAAMRLLSKLPAVQKAQSGSGDLREAIWTKMAEGDKDLQAVNYTTEVKPWLGSRAAFAGLAPANAKRDVPVIVALAVTDEGKARDWVSAMLTKKQAGSSKPTDVTVRSGYLLFTQRSDTAAVLAELDKGSLATNKDYLSDVAAMGDLGVASVWVDATAVGKSPLVDLAKSASPTGAASLPKDALQGRGLVALRLNENYLELAGVTRGGKDLGVAAATQVGSLPNNTALALGVAGMGDLVTKQWGELAKSLGPKDLADLERKSGMTLPDDLANLFGADFTLAMPAQDFTKLGRNELPTLGIKTVPRDGDRAKSVLDDLLVQSGADSQIVTRQSGNGLFVATNSGYLDSLSQGGNLGQDEAFKLAVPDADKSQVVFYLAVDGVEQQYLDQMKNSEYRDAVKAIRAVGLSARVTGPGEGNFTLRVVAN